jgi:adenylate cyclase
VKKAPRLTGIANLTPRGRTLAGMLIGLGVGAILVGLRRTDAVDGLEKRLVDVRTRAYAGDTRPDPGIVLAVVSQADIDDVAQTGNHWKWNLDVVQQAFEWLAECHPAAVVVDVLQFDRWLGPEEIEPANLTPEMVKLLEPRVAEVEALAEAYRHVGTVALAMKLHKPGEPGSKPVVRQARQAAFEAHLSRLPPIETRTSFVQAGVELPVLRLLRAAGSIGFVNADVDHDGVLRRATPVALVGGRALPSLPAAALLRYEAGGVRFLADRTETGGATQRLDAHGSFLVNFRGGSDSYATVRPSHMIRAGGLVLDWRDEGKKGPVPEFETAVRSAVEGKIVVWGFNPPGDKDVVSAPVSKNFPGPEYQATVIDNLLHGDGRIEASAIENGGATILLAVLLGLLGGALHRRIWFLVSLVVLGAATFLAGYRLFQAGTSYDLLTPVAALVLTYAGVTAFQLMTEGRRNKWLEGTFSQYLSPAVIEALKANPGLLELGGRECEISVLFSDVKSFTTISEKLGSNGTVRLLNDYLTRQSHWVLDSDGVIDKFIGDAVMAFFGDPVAFHDHALRACRSALRCVAAVPESLPLARSMGIEDLSNRIGIASGPATVGNMGSDRRFNYTAMGDTVNLASRLEGANKAFGSRILIGPLTYEHAKDSIVSKPIARLRVVGKTEPVSVHELLALKAEAPPELVAHAEAYGKAHAAILADDLAAARRALDEAERIRPKDGPCAWLRHLLDELEAGERPRPWDGIYVLESK